MAIFVNCVLLLVVISWAMWVAPRQFHLKGFRMRWKFMIQKMRPSVYWWMMTIFFKVGNLFAKMFKKQQFGNEEIWQKNSCWSLIEVIQIYVCIVYELLRFEVSHFSLDAHRACGYLWPACSSPTQWNSLCGCASVACTIYYVVSRLAHDLMRLDALSAEAFSPTLPPAMCSYLGAASLWPSWILEPMSLLYFFASSCPFWSPLKRKRKKQ